MWGVNDIKGGHCHAQDRKDGLSGILREFLTNMLTGCITDIDELMKALGQSPSQNHICLAVKFHLVFELSDLQREARARAFIGTLTLFKRTLQRICRFQSKVVEPFESTGQVLVGVSFE